MLSKKLSIRLLGDIKDHLEKIFGLSHRNIKIYVVKQNSREYNDLADRFRISKKDTEIDLHGLTMKYTANERKRLKTTETPIFIFYNNISSRKMLLATIIHEYLHVVFDEVLKNDGISTNKEELLVSAIEQSLMRALVLNDE